LQTRAVHLCLPGSSISDSVGPKKAPHLFSGEEIFRPVTIHVRNSDVRTHPEIAFLIYQNVMDIAIEKSAVKQNALRN
jgi:hypothetical protein